MHFVKGVLPAIRRFATRWRVPILILAAAGFFAGIWYSVRALALDWSDLSVGPILLVLLVLAPLTLAAASLSLQVSARALGLRIGFVEGVKVSALGNVAELLPLPGGAVVRGSALMRAGARLGESAWIVTLGAVLMLCLAAAVAGVPMILLRPAIGWPVALAGFGGAAVVAWWIARRSSVHVALAMVGARAMIAAVTVGRIAAAFAAIGFEVGLREAALFSVSATLGNAVTIVPAGLGIAEGIGAALALLAPTPPAAAFAAVALNRILGLCVSGTILLVGGWRTNGAAGAAGR